MSNDEPQTLKDVAQAALDNNRGMSGRQLDAEAKRRKLKIVYTTINHMAAGTYKSKPGRETLVALAELSGYTLEQVYRAARLPMPLKPFRDDLPEDADHLTGTQRRVVLDAIRQFAQQNLHAHALELELEEARSGDVDSDAAQKMTEDGATVHQFPVADEVTEGDEPPGLSEPDETLKPAADDVNEDDDEEPGGSDRS